MVDMTDFEDLPLGYLLSRVIAALRAEVSPVLESLGLTFPEYICMRLLSKSPGMSNAELAREANVSPQAMNTVLRGLQDRGLVTRPASVQSGRSLPAQLASKGTELLNRTDPGIWAAEDRVLGGLTAAQRREFKRLLGTVGTGLTAATHR
ncbi:MarR family winged helix-turn-helix transcriptional regulator [Mycobacterium sp.]|jgi:DNA-binding MarR family transcriptional regulator|uniref:MarR family winged helix-turn-helix transcriptional regulator n=1 Tax=Mycobacterium sp. TaxID=1785 RepID=UPI0039C9560B